MMELDLMFWGVLAILFILIEMATTALVSIWFVVGSLTAFGASMAGWDFLSQSYVFTGISVLVFCLTRPFVKKIKPKKEPTNFDRLIGMHGIVQSRIDNLRDEGRVLVNGLDWRARSSKSVILEPETIVTIDRIEGVTVWVSALTE